MIERGNIEISVEGDFMSLRYVGTFSVEDVHEALDDAARRIRIPGKKWRVLSDFSALKLSDAQGESIITQFSRDNRPYIDRSAVIGVSGLKSFIFDAIVRLSGRHKTLKRFSNREEAERWLKSH